MDDPQVRAIFVKNHLLMVWKFYSSLNLLLSPLEKRFSNSTEICLEDIFKKIFFSRTESSYITHNHLFLTEKVDGTKTCIQLGITQYFTSKSIFFLTKFDEAFDGEVDWHRHYIFSNTP